MTLFQNIPLLNTKLYMPQQPSYHIPREHLMASMSKALTSKVTFVTSPPGFGKTTLAGEWSLRGSVPVAWVSLDQGENDMLRFWTYVLAALHRLYPAVGHKSLSLLHTISFSAEDMIDWLLNDLFDLPNDVLLVLDDYHLIDSHDIHAQVAYFIDRMPPHVHLVLLSRKQPPIAVGKLRAQGALHEIGLKDLRFSLEEIGAFWLRQTGELPSEAILQLLSERTEGWAAGVQLAVLSQMSGQPHALNHFQGTHRYVVDYLMEEVFDHLPARLQSFLMKTSVVERMNTGLCAALTGQDVPADELREMEKANLFVIPLDAEGQWYRYHHLFGSFLRSKLGGVEDTRDLHRTACEWFAEHGFLGEAIEHALAAAAYERGAVLVLQSAPGMLKRRELSTLHRWLLQLPSAVRERPELLMIQVWTELLLGHQDRTEIHIDTLHQALQLPVHAMAPLMIGLREDLKVVRCYQAMLAGDFPLCYSLLQQMHEEESLPDVPMLFGMGMEMNAGSTPFIRGYYGFHGRIKQAKRYHRLYGSFIEKHGFSESPFTAYQRAALSEICYEQNQLGEAMRLAEDAIRIAKRNRVMGAYVPAEIVRCKMVWDKEGAASAVLIIQEAMAYVNTADLPGSRWHDLLHAYSIRCQLELGGTEDVDRWMAAAPWNKRNGMIGDQDDELLTYIRVCIARGCMSEALLWCDKLIQKASGSIMTEIEARVCLARIHHELNEPHTSLLHMHKALWLGEREGYLRIFAGKEQTFLLEHYAKVRKSKYMPDIQTDGVSLTYLQSLLAIAADECAAAVKHTSSVHMLTLREQEVLQLIADGLSNKAIAERLVLAEGTVKLHLHRIYSKLQVNGRVQAIQKANESKI